MRWRILDVKHANQRHRIHRSGRLGRAVIGARQRGVFADPDRQVQRDPLRAHHHRAERGTGDFRRETRAAAAASAHTHSSPICSPTTVPTTTSSSSPSTISTTASTTPLSSSSLPQGSISTSMRARLTRWPSHYMPNCLYSSAKNCSRSSCRWPATLTSMRPMPN